VKKQKTIMAETTARTVRLAGNGDAKLLADMSRTLIEHGLPWRWRSARIQGQIRNPEATVIVAEDAGVVSGFAIFNFAATSVHLNLLAVNPAYRRQGVATTLVNWLIESCGVAGITRINLEVRSTNKGAIQCYDWMGFESVGLQRGYYEGLEDARLMSLKLISDAFEQKRPT
jgi:ribosomal-protein-alanine N-acetyltransferase